MYVASVLLHYYLKKKRIHNLVTFRTKKFYHLDIGTSFSLRNTQGSKLVTVWLAVIKILSNLIYIIYIFLP